MSPNAFSKGTIMQKAHTNITHSRDHSLNRALQLDSSLKSYPVKQKFTVALKPEYSIRSIWWKIKSNKNFSSCVLSIELVLWTMKITLDHRWQTINKRSIERHAACSVLRSIERVVPTAHGCMIFKQTEGLSEVCLSSKNLWKKSAS